MAEFVPEAPEGAEYPLLYKARRWEDIVVGTSDDARWRDVSSQVSVISRTDVRRQQLRVQHTLQTKKQAK